MPTVLIIVGLVFMVIGLIVFLWPQRDSSRPVPQGVAGEMAELAKQINVLLDKFDKLQRPGLVLMLIGLALVGSGIYLETVDAKNAAEKATSTAPLARPLPLSKP